MPFGSGTWHPSYYFLILSAWRNVKTLVERTMNRMMTDSLRISTNVIGLNHPTLVQVQILPRSPINQQNKMKTPEEWFAISQRHITTQPSGFIKLIEAIQKDAIESVKKKCQHQTKKEKCQNKSNNAL